MLEPTWTFITQRSRCTLIALVIYSFNALHMGHIYHRDNCILVDTSELIKAPGNVLGSSRQVSHCCHVCMSVWKADKSISSVGKDHVVR